MNTEDIRESTKNIGRVTETNGVLRRLTGRNGISRTKGICKKTVPNNLRRMIHTADPGRALSWRRRAATWRRTRARTRARSAGSWSSGGPETYSDPRTWPATTRRWWSGLGLWPRLPEETGKICLVFEKCNRIHILAGLAFTRRW